MKKCWHPLYNYVLKVKNKYIELSGNTTCYNFNEMLEYAVENSIEHITEDFKREQKQKNKDSR